MKKIKLFFMIIQLIIGFSINAQQGEIIPDLSKIRDTSLWILINRELIPDTVVHLNEHSGNGVLWLNNFDFSNGKIELDIKGKNVAGKSFVGLAFHGTNDSTYDAIYFRPFNFKNPERSNHSVQYISQPDYTWYRLREEKPGRYESTVIPIPDPAEWFHATIIVESTMVTVFVNNSEEPSLAIELLSTEKTGKIGFWVGDNSEGCFENLTIIPSF